MRLSKVMALLYALEKHGLSLAERSVFDYGFGAGTFFRHCPKQCYLFGVELDSVNVEHVKNSLGKRGYIHVDLRTIDETRWEVHELLAGHYDVVVCSHVLEHVREPVELLKRLISCLTPEGYLLGAVPINELVPHENHERVIERRVVEEWARAADAEIVGYCELDHFTYYALPIFHGKSALGRFLALGTSLGLGVSATLLGKRLWFALDTLFGKVTRAKPAQAVFLMRSQ